MNNSTRHAGVSKTLSLAVTCFGLLVASAACSGAEPAENVGHDHENLRTSAPGIGAEVDLYQDVESGPETVESPEPALGEGASPNAVGAFAGIVALSNCSGSLVRYTTSRSTDRAMVLTNGHCFEGGSIRAGAAVANRRSTRTFRVLTAAGTGDLGKVNASRVLYGTMTYTDMLLYELTETFQQITGRLRVSPLTIANQRPGEGEEILIASGYWRRSYSCSIDKFIHELREGTWTFTDSIKYTEPGCQVIGGTSGSPILRALTREVIGINNTGNMNGGRCSVNNPCEVDQAGKVTIDRGGSYGQQLHLLYDCLTPNNTLDLQRPGCRLTRP